MNKSARFKMRTLCSRPFAVASLAIGALTLSAPYKPKGLNKPKGLILLRPIWCQISLGWRQSPIPNW